MLLIEHVTPQVYSAAQGDGVRENLCMNWNTNTYNRLHRYVYVLRV